MTAGNMSFWLEKNLASHIFGSGTLSKPSVIAIALCSNVSANTDTGSLSTGAELANSGAYARQSSNPSSSNWLDPVTAVGTGGLCSGLQTITFPVATLNWGWISGVAICDSATYGAGNMWFYGALTLPKLISSGDQFKFNPTDIQVTFD